MHAFWPNNTFKIEDLSIEEGVQEKNAVLDLINWHKKYIDPLKTSPESQNCSWHRKNMSSKTKLKISRKVETREKYQLRHPTYIIVGRIPNQKRRMASSGKKYL